mmetsp:Transcript_34477/g.42492  ORF Transcript_34477/g.42492 Transcript_34477/m.42492 type:complete len:273 (-) Transcript_34477:815-1633(-)
MDDTRVGFIGAGMMASALMKGFVKKKVVTSAANIFASDVAPTAKANVEEMGGNFVASNVEVVQQSNIIFIAVKPGIVPKILEEIKPYVNDTKLIVSIAAGVPINTLESGLAPSSRVIRVMPNTPCLVSEMAAGYSAGNFALAKDMEVIGTMLNAVGTAMSCPEKDLNAVTGLSGSGPAYIFLLIEALADGGVRVGLTRDTALKLAAQTVKGSAQMVLETAMHPGVLKDQVCSPGGTTIAGVEALENKGFRAAAIAAVVAAKKRADELSQNKL